MILALSLGMFTSPAKAEKGWASLIGPIVGVPVGGVSGLIRGAFSKGSTYSNSLKEGLGDNAIAGFFGIPIGFVSGFATGGISGLIKGVTDGLVLGIEDPLSARSGSLEGDLLDYEPYALFDYGNEDKEQKVQ